MKSLVKNIKSLFFIVFLILEGSFWGYSQNKNVKNYFNEINKAELFITNQEYSNALSCYNRAFSKFKNAFAIDYYNALICSLYLRDTINTLKISKNLVSKGLGIDFFRDTLFKPMNNNPNWQNFLLNLSTNNNKFYEKIDTQLRLKIESLLNEDQMFRGDDSKQRNLISNKDSIIHDELDSLFKKHGFPDENKVGVWFNHKPKFRFNLTGSPLNIILIHQLKSKKLDIYEYLLKNTLEGKLYPPLITSLSDAWREYSTLKFGCTQVFQTIYLQIGNKLCSCEDEYKDINKNRKKYYIESIEDQRKKINFYYFINKDFILRASFGVQYIAISSEVEIENFIKNNKLKVIRTLKNDEPYFK